MNNSEVPPDVDFKIPTWSGKPPMGAHLDVMKGDKLLQKLMIDEKRCYFFGRNPKMCDFAVEHASCSRVHAALVYHKHLNRSFLVDLGSAHGTYIGKVRLEANKPEQVLVDQTFHFGASTRKYVLREKLATVAYKEDSDDLSSIDKASARFLGLPEKEDDLDNLTEYNTALNRRIAAMTVAEDQYQRFGRKRRQVSVNFKEDEDIINPEDVDPNVGRFRNMVQTAMIVTKKPRLSYEVHPNSEISSPTTPTSGSGGHHPGAGVHFHPFSGSTKLAMPNIAPEVELYPPSLPAPVYPAGAGMKHPAASDYGQMVGGEIEEGPKKKKYAKEAWPGKKPGQHLLM